MNRFPKRMRGPEEIIAATNSACGKDELSLLMVKNFSWGGNPLGAFGLVCLRKVFREDIFPNGGGCFFEDMEEIAGWRGVVGRLADWEFLKGSPCFGPCLPWGDRSNRGVCSIWVEGGVRFNILPSIPLFSGISSRSWGIRGGCGVWLRILTSISLSLAVAPCRDSENRVIFFSGRGRGQV